MYLEKIIENWYWLMPEIYLIVMVVSLLAYGVIYGASTEGRYSQLKKITWLSIITLILTSFIVMYLYSQLDGRIEIAGIIGIDKFNLFVKEIVLFSGAAVLLLSLDSYTQENIKEFEYTQLVLLSILGMLILVSSQDLIILYLAIELISLSLYTLAAIKRDKELSTEAGLKYFIMGALSSGLLLIGCTILYIETGDTNFIAISNYVIYSVNPGIELGALMVIIAMLFKLAAAPFHMWVPDVYEGSPTIVTGYFAIVPKIALLTILINLLFGPFLGIWNNMLQAVILGSAILSIIIASIGGINQAMFKRLIGYSAIGHMGFMLLGIGVATFASIQATLIYAVLYILMSINSFACVLCIWRGGENHISRLCTISRTSPILAITFVICLFSIAGIPPLAGFLSKYLVLLTAVEGKFTILAIIAVLFTCISCFYYLRLIHYIYFQDKSLYLVRALNENVEKKNRSVREISIERSLLLGSTLYVILTLLIYPQPLLMLSFDCLINSLY
jgi:NADH-quinone oxidoreductase subunit N